MKYKTLVSVLFFLVIILLEGCGQVQVIPTPTLLQPSSTLTPIPTSTNTLTPTATNTPIPSSTPTPTVSPTQTLEEQYGSLAPVEENYILGNSGWHSYYGGDTRISEINAYFTGENRVVERFSERLKRNITQVDIKVVFRTSDGMLDYAWVLLGFRDDGDNICTSILSG